MTREDRFSLAPRSLASVDDTVLAAQMRKQNVAEKCAGIPSASGFASIKPSKKLQTRFYSAAATSFEEDAKPRSPAGANKRFMENLRAVNLDSVSKVVDENGEPLVVYHGTRSADSEEFDKSRIGSRIVFPADARCGFYFAKDRELAKRYGERIIPAFIARDPLFLNSKMVAPLGIGQKKLIRLVRLSLRRSSRCDLGSVSGGYPFSRERATPAYAQVTGKNWPRSS
jgi:hypothetical protein